MEHIGLELSLGTLSFKDVTAFLVGRSCLPRLLLGREDVPSSPCLGKERTVLKGKEPGLRS